MWELEFWLLESGCHLGLGSSAAQTSIWDDVEGSIHVSWHTQLLQLGLHENVQALEVGRVPMSFSILAHRQPECSRAPLSKLDQIWFFVADGLCQTCQVFGAESSCARLLFVLICRVKHML